MSDGIALEARGVNKRFGGVVAADGIELKVKQGELRCIIGPNGAGKSTLFSLLCGIQRVDSGQIFIHKHDATRMHQFQRVRLGVGLTFQTNRAYQQLTVQQNLAVPNSHLSYNKENHEIARERLIIALEGFELDPHDETLAGDLPHHKLQWLEISMVLAGCPDLVLIDEPTAGMSRSETNRTAEVLSKLNTYGLTIVVVEHDIHFVKSVAQVVTVLHQGKIFMEGNVSQITTNEDVKKIYLGHAH